MQFFIDTANLEEIKKYHKLGLVDGVTTNPSLIAKEGVDLKERILDICEIVDGPISCEVISEDSKGMIKEGLEYHSWHSNIYVKLPCTDQGLIALQELKKSKVKTNLTLVFSPLQALSVAKLGADLVSPFVGRLDDTQANGMDCVSDIMQIFINYELPTQVLVASVRTVQHVLDAALVGADICTISPAVYSKLIKHPLTDIGLKKFLEDYKNSQKK